MRKITLLLGLAFAAIHARANTIIVTYNGEVTSQAIQRFIVDDPTNPGWVDTSTGEFNFLRTGGDFAGGPFGSFYAFCIEPREFVSDGSSYTYNLVTLDHGTTNIGGMGMAKADLLRELFGRYYPVLGAPLDAQHASAMQISIWEIVRETSGTLNVTSGNITFRNPADPAALTLAQSYLSSLNGTGPRLQNLYALDNVGAQDVVVQIISNPEPATLFMMGAALIGIGVIWRRQLPAGLRRS